MNACARGLHLDGVGRQVLLEALVRDELLALDVDAALPVAAGDHDVDLELFSETDEGRGGRALPREVEDGAACDHQADEGHRHQPENRRAAPRAAGGANRRGRALGLAGATVSARAIGVALVRVAVRAAPVGASLREREQRRVGDGGRSCRVDRHLPGFRTVHRVRAALADVVPAEVLMTAARTPPGHLDLPLSHRRSIPPVEAGH